MQSPPAAQLTRERHQNSHQIPGKSEFYGETTVINISIYPGSPIIVVVAASMDISALLKVREIPDETSLVILNDSGAGQGGSTCDDDGASQVDSTGITAINMLIKIQP